MRGAEGRKWEDFKLFHYIALLYKFVIEKIEFFFAHIVFFFKFEHLPHLSITIWYENEVHFLPYFPFTLLKIGKLKYGTILPFLLLILFKI